MVVSKEPYAVRSHHDLKRVLRIITKRLCRASDTEDRHKQRETASKAAFRYFFVTGRPCPLRGKISEAAKEEILARFSEEPGDGYVWSEQDSYEPMRKIIRKYE